MRELPDDFVLPPARFAHSPADALQCLIDVKRNQERAMRYMESSGEYSDLGSGWQSDWRGLAEKWRPYFWSSHTAHLVRAASVSYPLTEEQGRCAADFLAAGARGDPAPRRESFLPRLTSAFCVFSEPVLTRHWRGREVTISALAWNVVIEPPSRLALALTGVVWLAGGRSFVVLNFIGDSTEQDEDVQTWTKWVCTAAMFLEQTVITSSRATLDRGARRRAEKLGHDPTCHVVQLRPALEADRLAPGDHAVEWSHRWIVKGHWRRQYFPSRKANAPVWIHPHVKGPDDKPFVDPKPTVFSVNR
jgi:hypothetical protein